MGNGWPGARVIARGVSIGNACSSKNSVRCRFSSSLRSFQRRIRIPCSGSSPSSRSSSTRYCRSTRPRRRMAIASSCSAGVRPSGDVSVTPAAAACLRPATFTWKNSSRFVEKMARNRNRARSGTLGSSARPSTRPLNSSQLSSALMNCSGARASTSSASSGSIGTVSSMSVFRDDTANSSVGSTVSPRQSSRVVADHSGRRSERDAMVSAARVFG